MRKILNSPWNLEPKLLKNAAWALFFFVGGSFVGTRAAVPQADSSPNINRYTKQRGIQDTSAFCYKHKFNDTVVGKNTTIPVKVASVSKLFTSLYALSVLPKDFRFKTRFYYNKETRDLLVLGSRDPFMGRRSLQMILSELNKNGITEIRNFVFDSRFAVYLDVEETRRNIMWSDASIPREVRYYGRGIDRSLADLQKFANYYRSDYAKTSKAAAAAQVQLMPGLKFKVESFYASEADLMPPSGAELAQYTSFEYASAPIIQYVKNLNNFSNNYAADQLLAALGGIEQMKRFFRNKAWGFGFNEEMMKFNTGSGLWINSEDDHQSIWSDRYPDSKDNLASCEAVLKVIAGLDDLMAKKYGMDLAQIVAVAGADEGTLSGIRAYKSTELKDAVIAKTGKLNSAATFAGEVSTQKGIYYFAILFETTGPRASDRAVAYREAIVRELVKAGGGKIPISYQPMAFLPFDRGSALRILEPNGSPRPKVAALNP